MALRLFQRASSQLLIAPGGIVGLDYDKLEKTARLAGLAEHLTPKVFALVQVIEREFVALANRKPKKKA